MKDKLLNKLVTGEIKQTSNKTVETIFFSKTKEQKKAQASSTGMAFGMAIETCFKKYATFDGQASRSEFWYFYLFGIICTALATLIDVFIFGISLDNFGYAYAITQLILFLPAISVGARRLHDTGRSGWWQLIILTGIGIILLII